MQRGLFFVPQDRSIAIFATLLGIALTLPHLGCDNADKRPVLPANRAGDARSATSSPNSEAITIAHPEYDNWSRFPKGASIVRSRVVTNEFGEVQVTTKMWLEDKNEREVLVGSQIRVVRTGDYPEENNPPNTTRYAATFALPQGMTPEYFQLPSDKAKLVGQETVQIANRDFPTDVFEWTENNEAGPMRIKLWRSNEVPGRIVRQEMLTESSNTKTLEVISQLDLEGKVNPSEVNSSETREPNADLTTREDAR